METTSIGVSEHGWTCLDAILDCRTCEITGWALDVRCRADDAITVLGTAVADRAPGALTPGTDTVSSGVMWPADLVEGQRGAGMTEASSPFHAQPAVIAPHPPLASWTSRAKALTVDWLMLPVPAVVLFLVLVVPELVDTPPPDSEADWGAVAASVLFLALMLLVGIAWALFVVLMMIRKGERNGQTWGKQIIGIRAVRDNGEPWRFGSAAGREVLLKSIAAPVLSLLIPIVPGLVWLVNFLWPLWDDQKRALHDMAVSSHVVRA